VKYLKSLKNIVYELVSEKLIELNTILNKEVEVLLKNYDGPFSKELKENSEIAKEKKLPLCQDTGIVEFFVFKPFNLELEESIQKTLFKAVKDVYEKHGYRKSTVIDPLYSRRNMLNNLPAIIHEFEIADERELKGIEDRKLEIWILVKGGGSENLSALFMMPPSSDEKLISTVILEHIKKHGPNACPPINVGIAIGGTADMAVTLSRLALFEYEPRISYLQEYNELSEKLFIEINQLKIGVQGLGQGPSCRKVRVLGYPTHIATLPVAISIDCYLSRVGRVIIDV